MHRNIIICILIVSSALLAGAQDDMPIKFGSINSIDGLAHNSVNDIVQDEYGFIWFGTMDGINRYDGSKFELFKNIPDDSTSLINNTVWSLERGVDNDILIGTAAGLCRFSYYTNQFEHIPISADDSNNGIRTLSLDRKNQIWTSSIDKGCFRIDNLYNDLAIKINSYSQYTSRAFTTYALQDQIDTNRVWLSIEGGLNSININNQEETDWQKEMQQKGFKKSIISSLVQDSMGRIWIGTNTNGLFRFNPTSQELVQYLPNGNESSIASINIADLHIDHKRRLWITSFGGGLSVMTDMEKGIFSQYGKKVFTDYALASNTLTKIIEDKDGRIWIGTHGAGIHFYDQDIAPFQLYRSNDQDPLSISSNNITSIYEDSDNNTWVSTRENGVNKITWADNGQRIKSLTKYNAKEGDPHSLNISTTNSYLETDELGLIFGNRLGGLNIYESDKDRFRDYFLKPGDIDDLKGYHVNDMYASVNGDIWMATSIGVYKWDMAVMELVNFNISNPQLESLKDQYIRFVNERNGILWIGVSNVGLWAWHIAEQKLKKYDHSMQDGYGLNTNNLLCGHFDDHNQLWIGTWEGGLNKLDLTTDRFKYYTEKNGMTNDVVYNIQEDNDGFLWLSTNSGIIRFDPNEEHFNTFGIKDGLQGEEYNAHAGYRSEKTGRILFGGMNGLNQFDPSTIKVDTFIPDIILTNLLIHETNRDEPRAISGILDKKKITVSHKAYLLEFEFGAPKYPSNNVRFAYRVKGLSDRWIDLEQRKEFSLTNLAPGTYTLDIRSGLDGGRWSDNIESISIVSRPPWWQTWWAYILYVAIIASILYLIYKSRVSQLVKYQKLRTQISSDLHDDVGTILSAMAFQTEILELEQDPSEKDKFKKITDMSRLALGRMRDTVWAIDSRKDNAESLVDRMEDFLFDVFEGQEIDYTFNKSILSKDLKIRPDIRQTVYLVFKEAVTNALKHSTGDQINIALDLTGKGFGLTVHDNGAVDTSTIKKSGLGLSNMQARAEKVDADFSLSYDDGFRVELRKV